MCVYVCWILFAVFVMEEKCSIVFTCVVDCCLPNPVCGDFKCGSLTHPKEGMSAIICFKAECVESDCWLVYAFRTPSFVHFVCIVL